MKKKYLKVFTFLASLCMSATADAQPTSSIPIPNDWTFNYYPETKENPLINLPDFNDANWQAISLPHTWSTHETTGDKHPFIKSPSEQDDPYWWKGVGYYRKKILFTSQIKDKKVFVEFDGVQKYARIYLNGKFIEDHKGGYNSFYVDLTPHIQPGKENLLVVAVSNRRDDINRTPPMTAGNFNVYGGIYRAVRLTVKDRLFIPYQGSYKHEGGSFVSTQNVSKEKADVLFKTFVQNEYSTPQTCTLETKITDPSGKVIATLQKTQTIQPGELFNFGQQTQVQKPKLWSPESPSLYKVSFRLLQNGKQIDSHQSPLGFRWFRWDYEHNELYVNGKKMNIKGINRHQEYPWLGDAIPYWITKMDLIDIKINLGHNFMRAAHYPNDPYFYHLADSLGIVMIEEVPNIKSIDFNEETQEQNVKEMIRRDRNHPSIFFWSMGNETSDAADSKWAVKEDTTRIIHLRKGEGGGDFVQHTDRNLDLEQLLRVTLRGWFDAENAPKGFSSTPKNGQFASNETWQWQNAMIDSGSTRGILGMNCSAWLYEDHGCDREYLHSPVKHINAKGWVDVYREPKFIYYLTKAMYTDIPVINMHQHVWRKQYIGQTKDVVVDSNCDEITLYVNGKKEGTLFPAKNKFPTATFENVRVEEGELKVIGWKNKKKYEQRIMMPGAPARIVLESNQKVITANRAGIAIVRANILDGKGNPVTDASNTLNWTVTGAGKLAGMGEYQSDIMKHEAMEGSGYTIVPISNVIRSGNQPGVITVTVSSPGLQSASIKISAVAAKSPANAFVSLPPLSEVNRKNVSRDLKYSEQVRFTETIKPLPGNVFLDGKDLATLSQSLLEFIKTKNPLIDTTEKGLRVMVSKMVPRILRQNGELIADDYNFTANNYNQYDTFLQLIDSKSFHPIFSKVLADHLQESLLEQNKLLNFAEEFERIKMIPSKQNALVIRPVDSQNPEGKSFKDNVLNTTSVHAASASAALAHLYPEFAAMSADRKAKILEYITTCNPQITLKNDKWIANSTWIENNPYIFGHGIAAPGSVIVFAPQLPFLKQNF